MPIPVFYHTETKEPLLNEETVDHIKCKPQTKLLDSFELI